MGQHGFLVSVYKITQVFVIYLMCYSEILNASSSELEESSDFNISTTDLPLRSNRIVNHNKPKGDIAIASNNNLSKSGSEHSLFSAENFALRDYLKTLDLKIIPGYSLKDDFENWTPPVEIQRDLPAYFSGFTYTNQSIWIMEYGKWNYGKYLNKNKKLHALYEKYHRYIVYLALKSQGIKSTKENRIDQHVIIYDFEGLHLDFLANPRILQAQRKLAQQYQRYFQKHISKLIIINVNPVAEVLINIVKPFFVKIAERVEVYGTNKASWYPVLLKMCQKDQIPGWYGDSNDFKPLYVIG